MFPTSTSCCLTTPPISTTTRTMLPRKHGPPGMPPSASRAGITSSQPSGSLKSERSESERAGIEPPFAFRLWRHARTLAQVTFLGVDGNAAPRHVARVEQRRSRRSRPQASTDESASGRAAQRKRREEAPQETEARRVEQPALKVNGV